MKYIKKILSDFVSLLFGAPEDGERTHSWSKILLVIFGLGVIVTMLIIGKGQAY